MGFLALLVSFQWEMALHLHYLKIMMRQPIRQLSKELILLKLGMMLLGLSMVGELLLMLRLVIIVLPISL